VPSGLIPLLKIKGLGSKRIAKLYQTLNVTDKESFQKACENGEVSALNGFGKKTEQNYLEAVKALGSKKDRYPIGTMIKLKQMISDYLSHIDEIEQYEVAGSFRRMKEMSKDLDFIISTYEPLKVQSALLKIPNKVEEVAVGHTKVSLELEYDDEVIGVDFRMIEPTRQAEISYAVFCLKIKIGIVWFMFYHLAFIIYVSTFQFAVPGLFSQVDS
ncbi:hypothetical protein, partial [Streptococcus suis]